MKARISVAERHKRRLRLSRLKRRRIRFDPYNFRPLKMCLWFWRDVDMLHVRVMRMAGYQPRGRRDMEAGWK